MTTVKCFDESTDQNVPQMTMGQTGFVETDCSGSLTSTDIETCPLDRFCQLIPVSVPMESDSVVVTNFTNSSGQTGGSGGNEETLESSDVSVEEVSSGPVNQTEDSLTTKPQRLELARSHATSAHVANGQMYRLDKNHNDRIIFNRRRIKRSNGLSSVEIQESVSVRKKKRGDRSASGKSLRVKIVEKEPMDDFAVEATENEDQSVPFTTALANSPTDDSDNHAPEENKSDQSLSKQVESDSTAKMRMDGVSPDFFPNSVSPKQTEKREKQRKQLSRRMKELKRRIHRTLESYYFRQLDVSERSPWAIMHSFLAYGVDTEIVRNYTDRRGANAIGWLCFNGLGGGEPLFYLSNGQMRPRTGPGLQGHEGQFLAMLAQSKVKRDFPMKIGNHKFTVDDLIEYEMKTCYHGSELTFKLIALVHYLDLDADWKNDQGESWNLPLIIEEELDQPIRGAACGGTHRIMSFSYAVRTCQRKNGKVEGEWKRAEKFVEDYHKYAFSLQNRDGSFSSNWFEGRGDWGDTARKLQTTGHILEWLVFSLTPDRLTDPRIVKSVNFLTNLLAENLDEKLEIGPQSHALHALALYESSVFGESIGDYRSRFVDRSRGNRNWPIGERNWLKQIFR